MIRTTYVSACAALVCATLTATAYADCQPEQPWHHEHATEKRKTYTTDIKGTRSTTIKVCRAVSPPGKGLTFELKFAGSARLDTLEPGECIDRFAKWAVVKTTGTRGADGATVVAEGTYQVCKE